MKKAIFIVEDKKCAQFRYRVKNIIEALTESEKWRAEYSMKSEISKVEGWLDDIDLVVIERQAARDDTVLKLIKKVKARKIKVLMDLDDLIFDYRDLSVLMRATGSKNLVYWLGYCWGIRRIARRVDGFICTNEFLAEKLKRSFGKPVRVIKNSLNQEQIKVSGKVLEKKRIEKKKRFVIGYFSGSPTHRKDFELVELELVKFLEAHDDVRIRVVGYMKFSDRMKKMIDSGRIEMHEPVDYLRLQELMGEVDVNIAPLVVNDFTNCKSELKFFEAAVVETTTIASPTYTFKEAITDGENGFLAQPGEWYDKLEYLYKHPQKNKEIARKAREYALEHYYGKEFLKEVEGAYGYFAG